MGGYSDRKRRLRQRIRQAYACDCSGDKRPGRPGALSGGTDQVRGVVFEWTGEAQSSCPWRALRDPFVRRVLDVYPWFESGQITTFAPEASHRLIEGVGYYHRTLSMCLGKRMELDHEEARKK